MTTSPIPLPTGYANFYHSHAVTIRKVHFKNAYGIDIVGNLVLPKHNQEGVRLPAIIIGHPMGAVKEQASMLYAQVLAEQGGFATLAIDMPFWGESGGTPRQAVEPTMFEDAFSAAVDFLSTQPMINQSKIGVLGICASGGYGLSAMKVDSRIRAMATVSMVDMGSASRAMNVAAGIDAAMRQREVEFKGGAPLYTGGTVTEINADTNPMQKEFYAFYRTPRGEFTPKGADKNHTTMSLLSQNPKLLNFYPLNDMDTIKRPLLFIAGDQAMSKGFSEEAYRHAAEPKEIYYVKSANHTDLYDNADKIPFLKLVSFFQKYVQSGK